MRSQTEAPSSLGRGLMKNEPHFLQADEPQPGSDKATIAPFVPLRGSTGWNATWGVALDSAAIQKPAINTRGHDLELLCMHLVMHALQPRRFAHA